MSARSHESITPSNGAILRGWVPFRDDPAGGTARAPSARYFFTVRQSQPASAAISAYDAPASCRTRNLRMFIQFSGCRIIEEITLRCSRLGSRHNEGWSTSQGRQGQSARTPAPGHSARQPHTQPRRPPPPHSRTGPARQGTHPAHPGRHIRSYAIRQQRSYADNWLDELPLPQPYAGKVASLRQLAGALTAEITLLDHVIADLLAGHEGYHAIQALPGIGPVLAAVIVAEIGDIRRFPGPGQLGSWAGLTPRHYESDTKVIRGHVTKQGSRMLRWAVTEAIQRQPTGSRPRQVKDAIIARRGKEAKNIARIAAARELLTLVFYGMRDGRIRRLAKPRPAA